MRALLVVLDSVGVGHAPDAQKYGDEGANTLGHIFAALPDFQLPNLAALGLDELIGRGNGEGRTYQTSYGKMREQSAGKDTTTGHWELAGLIVSEPFSVFEKFPEPLVSAIEDEAGIQFIGNYPRSGTTILEELGREHLATGKPILYTSADSVLQIAAHEKIVPIERLYEICRIARNKADAYRIGRVIARPFIGEPGAFQRTTRRHDFSIKPDATILNALLAAGFKVKSVGKISDIFAGEGISESYPAESNRQGMEEIERLWAADDDSLIFANLVDFDMMYGHRRDVKGYAASLLEFDKWLGRFKEQIRPDDLVIITADHGNDPTFAGTDHTREEVPLLVFHKRESRNLGTRSTYADVAASLAEFFQLSDSWHTGRSFLKAVPV